MFLLSYCRRYGNTDVVRVHRVFGYYTVTGMRSTEPDAQSAVICPRRFNERVKNSRRLGLLLHYSCGPRRQRTLQRTLISWLNTNVGVGVNTTL